MSFEEELKEAIQRAQTENAQEENYLRSFMALWEALKVGMLWRTLKAAERVLMDAHLGAHADLSNGFVFLDAKWNNRRNNFDHRLKFSPRPGTLEVVCSSSIKDEPEDAYAIENLTEAVIEAKIKRFVYSSIRLPQGSA